MGTSGIATDDADEEEKDEGVDENDDNRDDEEEGDGAPRKLPLRHKGSFSLPVSTELYRTPIPWPLQNCGEYKDGGNGFTICTAPVPTTRQSASTTVLAATTLRLNRTAASSSCVYFQCRKMAECWSTRERCRIDSMYLSPYWYNKSAFLNRSSHVRSRAM